MSAYEQKQKAAMHALGYVEEGMVVGLGTGSTAEHFVRGLGDRVAEGLAVTGVSTSVQTDELAESCGISLTSIDDIPSIDLTVDGADEVDDQLCLIKGGGGALLREKIVAAVSDRMIIIIDESKLVDFLGTFPLPIEVVPFGYSVTASKIRRILINEGCSGHDISLRKNKGGDAFVSDGRNYILDCACTNLINPRKLAERLNAVPGIVEHGLFIDLASSVIVGRNDRVDVIEARG